MKKFQELLKANPDVRLMLLTHLSHRTGLIPPVKEIVAMARARGVGELIRARLADRTVIGVFKDLDSSGALVLDCEGVERRIIAGAILRA